MKIIHTGDLHLDSSLESNLNKEIAKQRRNELITSFLSLVEYAKSNEVDAIIIAGDMFDKDRQLLSTKKTILDCIKKNPYMDFLYLSGNHDKDSFIDSIDEIPNNLKVFGDNWTSFKYNNVTITGMKTDSNSKSYMYDSLNLDKDSINIVVLHGDINNDIKLDMLKNKNIDYLALGHIHSYQDGKIDDRGDYAYCGCLEARGFDEEGMKGFVILDCKNFKVSHQFIARSKRVLHNIELDITNISSGIDLINAAMKLVDSISPNDMLRITLIGTYNIDLDKRLDILDEKLNNMFFFASIKDNSHLKINKEDYKGELSLKGEFINMVLDSDIDNKDQIIELGLKALMKEEI